jgi:hypothetical protein
VYGKKKRKEEQCVVGSSEEVSSRINVNVNITPMGQESGAGMQIVKKAP